MMPAIAVPAMVSQSSWGERTARIVFWVLAYVMLFRVLLTAGLLATDGPDGATEEVDFAAFWAAARLTLAGQPLAAFDPETLWSASGLAEDQPLNMLWLYPPHFLALIAPLGALPYWAAWCLFNVASVVALALAARSPARPLPGGWRLIVVSPVVVYSVVDIGQTAALWAAALIAALWSLQRQRPASAGAWLALMTMKPHLGLLIPVALLADHRWRALAWGATFTFALALGATLAFGAVYWEAFLDALTDLAARIEDGTMSATRLVSVYGLGHGLGLDHSVALQVHWSMALALAAAVAWVWSRREIGADLKAATLCAALPLATPYAQYYEMMTTLVAGLFLVRDGFGRGLLAWLWLVVIWVGPMPAVLLPSLTDLVALPSVPIILVTLAICLVRAWARVRPPEPEREAGNTE